MAFGFGSGVFVVCFGFFFGAFALHVGFVVGCTLGGGVGVVLGWVGGVVFAGCFVVELAEDAGWTSFDVSREGFAVC